VKNGPVVTLKTDTNCSWIAVLDPASGKRGRYTVYRLYRWADKRADIIGRELDLAAAKKLVGKRLPNYEAPGSNFDHDCDWRKAALMLAKCVVATIQTGGKIGMGSGMVMKVVDGKRIIARWDKDFIEALTFIGIEMADKKPADKKKSKPTKAESKKPAASSRGARAA
jgi:hypothetical protein